MKSLFLLLALAALPLQAQAQKPMTMKEAEHFMKTEDYSSCQSDDECVLTTHICDTTVSVNKNKLNDYNRAVEVMGTIVDCKPPAAKKQYYSACQQNKCEAVIKPEASTP